MSDSVVYGRTLGWWRLLAADAYFVGGALLVCTGLLGDVPLRAAVPFVAAALLGSSLLIGFREAATVLLGGRATDGEPDPTLSLAVAVPAVMAWMAILIGLSTKVATLPWSVRSRAALLIAAGISLVVALRGMRWLLRRRRAKRAALEVIAQLPAGSH